MKQEQNLKTKLRRKLKMGMVGGGPGAFIGDVHLKAAHLDGTIELVAGAFSSDPNKSHERGKELNLKSVRVYDNYTQMITNEKKLPEGERIDFVTITTPNNSHFPISRDFLNNGFHVLCEKPMTFDIKEANDLEKIVKESGLVFGVNFNYTGYPMVKLARDLVKQEDLGKIRKIVVIYPQGWLADPIEKAGSKQAEWRTDPKQSGAAGCLGDIGVHAHNLSEYISGLKVTQLCADLTTFVPNRKLDDDVNILLRFEEGAKGVLHASQISIGEENGLAIWIYGEKGGLEWHQEHPNYLYVKKPDAPVQIWRRGNEYIGARSAAAARATRLPFGHPEAFIEDTANIYRNFGDTLCAAILDTAPNELALDFPDIDDGLRGMLFIETVLESANSDKKWTNFKT
jgi:predicted dehydrogenase